MPTIFHLINFTFAMFLLSTALYRKIVQPYVDAVGSSSNDDDDDDDCAVVVASYLSTSCAYLIRNLPECGIGFVQGVLLSSGFNALTANLVLASLSLVFSIFVFLNAVYEIFKYVCDQVTNSFYRRQDEDNDNKCNKSSATNMTIGS